MRRRQGTGHAPRVLLRWFLPLLLAVAVLAMHGLGHPSGHDGHMAGMAAGAPPHAAQMPAPHAPVSGPVMASRDATGTPAPGGLDPVAVCLAVLAGTLLLLPLLWRSGRLPSPAQARARAQAGRLRAGRSPPRAPALCMLQVLRLCGSGQPGSHLIRPDDPEVRAAEARRPRTGRTAAVTLTATAGDIDLGGPMVTTWSYGGLLPGREVRVRKGDVIEARLINKLPAPTSVHWHGLALRNDMDGVPGITQAAIQPDADSTYQFTVAAAGTYGSPSATGPRCTTQCTSTGTRSPSTAPASARTPSWCSPVRPSPATSTPTTPASG